MRPAPTGRGSLGERAARPRVPELRRGAPQLDGRVGPLARKLKLIEKTIILNVRPDPEPGDLVVLQKADGAISEGHAE